MTICEAFEISTKAFNTHHIARFATVLADDVVFEAPGDIHGEGKAACMQYYGDWFRAFPDAHVDVHALHLLGDVAVEQGTFTGTHDGILHDLTGDVRPTGRFVSLDYIQVHRFRDGLLASFTLMFDRLLMLEQLGFSALAWSAADIWLEWPACPSTLPESQSRSDEKGQAGSDRRPEPRTAIGVSTMARMWAREPVSTAPLMASGARQAAEHREDDVERREHGGKAAHSADIASSPIFGGRP
jgi:ketosteroid isomerase-like protein